MNKLLPIIYRTTFIVVAILAVLDCFVRLGINFELDTDEHYSLFFARGSFSQIEDIYDVQENRGGNRDYYKGTKFKHFDNVLSPSKEQRQKYNFSTIEILREHNETHPPLYYLALKYWIKLWGTSEYQVRLLSLFFSVVALVFTFLAIRKLGGTSLALMGGAFVASSVNFLEYATKARMHSLTLLLTSIFLYLIVSLLGSIRKDKQLDSRHLWLCLVVNLCHLNSFLFVFIIAPFLGGYLMFSRLRFVKKLSIFIASHVLYVFYLLSSGIEQLMDLPKRDFLIPYDFTYFEVLVASFEHLTPLYPYSWFYYISTEKIFMLMLAFFAISVFFALWKKVDSRDRLIIAFSLSSVCLVLLFDFFNNSLINDWGLSRSVNFLKYSYLLPVVIGLKYLPFKKVLLLFSAVILSLGYFYNSSERHGYLYAHNFDGLKKIAPTLEVMSNKSYDFDIFIYQRFDSVLKASYYLADFFDDDSMLYVYDNKEALKDVLEISDRRAFIIHSASKYEPVSKYLENKTQGNVLDQTVEDKNHFYDEVYQFVFIL